jgi:hypothetical protein
MSPSVTLQNNVRLRIFLILVLSIVIRVLRQWSSNSVHKATGILEINYILYAIMLLCTLLPFKAAWMVAAVAVITAVVLGGVSTILGTIATARCLSGSQAGCVQSAPVDIIALVIAGIILFLDLLQAWSIYRIIRFPSFIASATARIRVLFAWAWPFAWMVNIALLIKSEWTFWVTPHLIIDPTLIILADSDELYLLGGLMFVALATDVISLLKVHLSLARLGLWALAGLTVAGILMLFVPTDQPKAVRSADAPKETPNQPEVKAAVVVDALENPKTLVRRHPKEIAF